MKVAVIGSGIMGLGIAQVFAVQDGYDVTICIEQGKNTEQEKERFAEQLQRLAAKGKITKQYCDAVIDQVTVGTIELAADAGLVVESVFEKFEVKSLVLKQLDQICPEDTIIVTNTSSIAISKLEKSMERPLLGMHFFNPAVVMQLIEVVTGERADQELIQKVIEITKDIGKVPVEVRDEPGFVVNRILIPMINEAIGVLAKGTASAEGIDLAMQYGANQPMGPLALGDLVGLDVCLGIMKVIYGETGDEKYKPQPLLEEMVKKNMLGKKTGKGFYEYE